VAALAAAARLEESLALMSPAPARASLRALAAAVVATLAVAAPAYATDPEVANFDARPAGAATTPPAAERARDRLRDRLGRFGALSLDEQTGTVRTVGRLDGFLTGPSARDGAAVALDYVRDHAAAFGLDGNDLQGLRLTDRSFVDGVEHISWEQRYRGIPVADAGLEAAITGSGRLLNVTGPPASDLAVRSIEPSVGAADAYAAARESGGDSRPKVDVAAREGGDEQVTRFDDGGRASLTLYHASSGYRLAWRALTPVSSTGVYDVLVDARSGEVVKRANRVKFAVPAKVFRNNPATGAQEPEDFERWLTPGLNTLEGPNAHAFLDVHDTVGPQPSGFQLTPEPGSDIAPVDDGYEFAVRTVPSYGVAPESDGCPGTATSFPSTICTWDPRSAAASSWTANQNQSATQLFYLVNTFHDHLRNDPTIAFDDGEFRATGKPLGDPNTGASADASDPVLAQALDGAAFAASEPTNGEHVNNANFLTLPDGYPGLMQMYLWKPPFGGYDGSNDAATVFHEYTHGLSGRLVTDSAGFEALSSAQAGAMSEGWSDFYAMDFLVAEGQPDAPGTADVRLGRYLDNNTGARVRVQPIDCSAASPAPCPSGGGAAGSGYFTYKDFGQISTGGPEFHDDGEIWAQTLWSLREALGVAKARRYITNGMRLSPLEPSFLDMRNAILEASTDPSDDAVMWTVFADRGMGYFASTEGGNETAPVADFTDPADLTGQATLEGEVTDQDGDLVQGAEVGIGALGDEAVTITAEDGSYALNVLVPGGGSHTYPSLRARKPAYADDVRPNVPLDDGETVVQDFVIERDWSSAVGGATIKEHTGRDNSDQGCGPGGLIDDHPGVVWGTENSAGGQKIVVDLGAPVDVARVEIDPAAGCGDDDTAALGGYELLGSTGPDGSFAALGSPGTFTAADNGRMNTAFPGIAPRIRFVALRALSPQSSGGSGAEYVDVAELHVARQPHTAVGPTANTGGAQAVGINGATLTGAITPHDGATEVFFEYGTSTGYGSTVAAGMLAAGTTATAVNAVAGGLQPSTTYHFRVVARSGGNSYPGADRTFTTAAAPSPTPTPAPSPTPTPTPPPTPGPVASVTSLSGARLTADRRGLFKVKVRFGDAAPVGRARITVSRKGNRLARASTPVRQGKTVTKTLRLSRNGRKVIRRGRTRKVKVQLRLPGGEKLAKTVKLTRKRR
jgi:extracellular elastinolytic metalloproteinase